MNKLKGIVATLYRPSSFNRATSMSFSSGANCNSGKSTILGRIQVTDKDLESEENLMDLYERWMRHYGKIRTDIDEKNRRFQTFKKKVMDMNLERHCILGMFSDTSREEYPNWRGCKLPSVEAESEGMSFEEWRARMSEFPHEETYEEMERRLLGRVE
ncbi:hypothetical protein C5167_001582 [Papaver somniferum]|uniref:Cathepsin propeptide inhibitor domain-containing protein n=1 Tax=Papaver somniferum TaxID=3469 RepID=A0A4Y7KVR3_PAPSO|nr:fruit bromelain-like [Papaver somniferum]RZC77433.1 hypothetical protein C5167_001582 [Papaver somniferum]